MASAKLITGAALALTLGVLAASAGLVTHGMLSAGPPGESLSTPDASPSGPRGEPAGRTDLIGDPLPPGVLARLGTVRFRHGGTVGAVAFSPDGQTLATGGHDGMVRLWDWAAGKERLRLKGETRKEDYESFVFCPDGKTLISTVSWTEPRGPVKIMDRDAEVRHDHFLRLWDLTTGRPLRELRPGADDFGVKVVALSSDGKLLASGHGDAAIRLWDLETGKLARTLPGGWQVGGPGTLALSPDSRTLAAGGNGHAADLWDVATGKLLPPASPAHDESVATLAVSPDGRTVVSGSYDRTVRLWDAATGRQLRALDVDKSTRWIALSPDGAVLAVEDMDRTIRLWETATGKERDRLRGMAEGQTVTCLVFSPDGRTLASGYHYSEIPADNRYGIRLWDLRTGRELYHRDGQTDEVGHLAFTSDGRMLASASADTRIRLWRVDTGRELFQFTVRAERRKYDPALLLPGGLAAVAFSSDGKLMASHDADGRVVVWELGRGLPLFSRKTPDVTLCRLAFSPDNKFLAVCAGANFYGQPTGPFDKTVRLWELASGQEVLALDRTPSGAVTKVAFFPDGRSLVTGMQDTTLLVWDLRADAPVKAQGSAGPAALWADLAHANAARAYQAMEALTVAPGEALALFQTRLRPAAAGDAERIRRLITDLDSDRFAVREAATAELERLGPLAGPALRQALKGRPSLEASDRVRQLLDRPQGGPVTCPDELRELRALVVLERLGTPEARRLLEVLAGGVPEARLTQEAKAALRRRCHSQDAPPAID